MRFVIYGAGAIGGVIGGRLFAAGNDVTLIARGPHLAALQSDGLDLLSPDDHLKLPVPAVEHPAELDLRAGDVMILAMKSQHTADALAALAAHAPADIAVVCAQNGVENERLALRRFPRVYAMTVMCPATHLEPGRVVAHAAPTSGILDLGCYPQGVDDTASGVAAVLRGATFAAEARPDILRWKYRKLMMNLANVAVALCAESLELATLVRRLRAEGDAALAAAGVDMVTIEEDKARRGNLLDGRPIEGVVRNGGSSWQSLARGTGSVETDYLTGEIVLLGRLHGVPTPASELLQRLANEAAASGQPPGSYDAGELLARL
jgi:2-dehydropantoate 2-reductase